MSAAVAIPSRAELRDYQQEAYNKLIAAAFRGIRRVLLVSPTGSGKGTLLAHMMAVSVSEKNKRVLFVVAGRDLVEQCSERLDEQFHLDHGIIQAGHWRAKPWLPVQVCSVDTLASLIRRGVPLPDADLIIIDEGDQAAAPRFKVVLACYPNAYVVGMTATPCRADGKGLGGDLFQEMIVAITPRELIDRGWLVDYAAIKFRAIAKGLEAHTPQSAAKNDLILGGERGKELAGLVVAEWHRHATGRRTVLFAVTRQHSRDLVARFNSERHHGAPIARAEHVDGTMSREIRKAIRARVLSGETQIVSNVGILGRGVDWPELEVCQWARSTASRALCLQQAGRVFRTCEATSKTSALLLDHAGNITKHGFPDDPQEWSLADGAVGGDDVERLTPPKTCIAPLPDGAPCGALYNVLRSKCPACGAANVSTPSDKGAIREVAEVETVMLKAVGARPAVQLPLVPESRPAPKPVPPGEPTPQDLRDAAQLEAQVGLCLTNGWNVRKAGHMFARGDTSRMPSDETLAKIEQRVRARLAHVKNRLAAVGGGR